MSEKFICALAELDELTQVEMRRLYELTTDLDFLGTQTKGLPYHLTLGYFDSGEEKDLMNLLNGISSKAMKFNLNFSHIGLFRLNVLFCAPDVNRELLELKDEVCGNLADHELDWTAHTTIIIDEEENIVSAFPVVSKGFKKIKGKITHISLYEFFPLRFIGRYELS